MPQGIVDVLEVVQIDVQNRKRTCPAPGRGIGLAQAFDECSAVRKSGEPIGARQQCDLLFGRLPFGNIDDDALDLDQPPTLVAHRGIAVLHPAVRAIARAQAKFDRRGLGILVEHPRHCGAHLCLVRRVHQCVGPARRPHQRFRIVAELGDVVRDVDERKRRLAAQAIQNGGAVLHDHIGVGQFLYVARPRHRHADQPGKRPERVRLRPAPLPLRARRVDEVQAPPQLPIDHDGNLQKRAHLRLLEQGEELTGQIVDEERRFSTHHRRRHRSRQMSRQIQVLQRRIVEHRRRARRTPFLTNT